MEQRRLFRIQPDAITFTMSWQHPGGWSLVASWSTAGEGGRTGGTERYDSLSSAELSDVVSCVLSGALNGIPG